MANKSINNTGLSALIGLIKNALKKVVSVESQSLTASEQQQARINTGSDVYCVLSQTQTFTRAASYDFHQYTMSNIQYGYCSKGFVQEWITRGGTFDTTTHYFGLNGLIDISYEEAVCIVSYSSKVSLCSNGSYVERYANFDGDGWWPGIWGPSKRYREKGTPRTLFPLYVGGMNSATTQKSAYSLFLATRCEILAIIGTIRLSSGSHYALARSPLLREIRDLVIDISGLSDLNELMGWNESLSSIRLKGLGFSFANGKRRYDWPSLKYLIANSSASSAINVGIQSAVLAEDAAAYLTDPDSDLETYPTLADWALSKNITLVS